MDCCSGTFQSEALQLCDNSALLHYSEMPAGRGGGGGERGEGVFFWMVHTVDSFPLHCE